MSPPRDEEFEAVVAERVDKELVQFLVTRARPPVVEVEVVVVRALSLQGRAAIVEQVGRVAHSYDVQGRTEILVDTDVGDPAGVLVDVRPLQERTAAPPTAPRVPGFGGAGAPYLLTIGIGGGHTFSYLLDEPVFTPLHRPDDDGERSGIVIPCSLRAVPAGRLLLLRHVEDTVEFTRTRSRPDVRIFVNGQELEPDRVEYAREHGSVEYRKAGTTGTTELSYRLVPWSHDRLEQGRRPPRADDPFRTWLSAGGGSVRIAVAQPAEWPPRPHAFPVPRAQHTGVYDDVRAQVLYTTATSDDDRRWHVKIYRCATPQHASLLRRHFGDQATLVDQVNLTCGQRGGVQQWAIAPFSVVAATADRAGEVTATVLGADANALLTDPEQRLPSWFGIGAADPASFLLVVSPLLDRIDFPDSRAVPGIETLADLATMAHGLDACHQRRVAHCDIKPDNVCWRIGTRSYVLVDADAVIRLDTPNVQLRFTERYASKDLRAWARAARAPGAVEDRPLDEKRLRAHDRFGFVVVVLAAVAGRRWVHTLLTTTADDHERLADRPEDVLASLLRLWGPRWQPLADELAAPFTRGALDGDAPWAAGWVERLAAVGAPLPAEPDPRPTTMPPPAEVGRWARVIAEIRSEVEELRIPNPRRPDAVGDAVDSRAVDAARGAAVAAFLQFTVLIAIIPLILLIGVILNG